MNKKTKLTAFIIFTIFIMCVILSACSSNSNSNTNNGNDNNSDNQGNSTAETTLSAQDERLAVSDDLTPDDYGGYNFRILYRNGCQRGTWAEYDVHKIEIATEAENGDVINDALYMRNKTVEDRFNLNIVGLPYPDGQTNEAAVAAYAKKSVLAGSDDFDLVVSWSTQVADVAAEGLFDDWNSLPNINMSKPWWIKDAMDAFTIDGKSYLAMNDIIFSGVVGEAAFIMFNKDLLEKFGLEDPYKMVDENRWTIDALDSIVKNCYVDVNGDGKRDSGDLYGFTSDAWGSAYAWMWAGGAHVTTKGADGLPYYDLYTEHNSNLLDKVYSLFYNNVGSAIRSNKNTIDFGNKGSADQESLFSSGNALFLSDRVGVLCTPEYRNAAFDYGILPMPKYDETQEKYLTMINEHASAMAIPKYEADLDRTGKIIEALCAESYKQLVPAYYEVSLKTKYSRDDESVKMLDLISAGVVYDFGLLYDIPTFDVYQTLLVDAKTPDTFASYIEKNQPKAEKKLQDILDLYDSINQ
ncbi:MAG: hypothetical protein FWD71_15305 [Oscillospiraceae bacterium]|nr:hypothetical protein [Oscillospiraceae bacterium]